MDESNSSDNGPSLPVPSLQDASIDIRGQGRTTSPGSEHDLRDPSESSPLLKVKRGTPPPVTELEAGGGQFSRRNWKNLITTICLWLTYLVVSAAYSIIGPYFPSEVGK